MAVLNALAFACALTAIFAFRFGIRRPGPLAIYFVSFGLLEWFAQAFFMPAGAIPIETAYVLFAITLLFVGASLVTRRFDKT